MSASDQARELLTRLYDSFGSGDPSAWTENVADDVVGIGSDPGEWWEGRDIVSRVGTEQVKQMSAAGIKLRPGAAQVFSAGDVVWAVDQPTIELPDGSTVPMRFTLVTTQHDGRPIIRHFHLSAGASNQEVLGEDLPTR